MVRKMGEDGVGPLYLYARRRLDDDIFLISFAVIGRRGEALMATGDL